MEYLALLSILLLVNTCHAASIEGEKELIGWQGETFDRARTFNADQVWEETLSWNPRVFMFHNFLSKEECEHIIELSKTQSAADIDTSSHERSEGYIIARDSHVEVDRIEKRIAELTHLPVLNSNPVQVMHFKASETSTLYHHLNGHVEVKKGAQQLATMLLYLSDVEDGGETVFPSGALGRMDVEGMSHCAAQQGWGIKPKRGDALLVYHLTPDAKEDPASMFADCPVLKGDKWIAIKKFFTRQIFPAN